MRVRLTVLITASEMTSGPPCVTFMSPEPHMPRDDEHLDDEVDPTSDTHVPDDDDEQGSSVFHDDDDEVNGTAVSDVTLRKADHSPLQDFVATEWTPGEQETFSTTPESHAIGEDEASPEVPQQSPAAGGDTDAPTVVIKGKRPDNPAPNSEFDAATEPLPSPESEGLHFAPQTSETADKSIDFPREERPEALPLPPFEPLAPPSLDASPAKPAIQPAASTPSDSGADSELTTDSNSASMPVLRGPEMESGLPLPTLSDASASSPSAATQPLAAAAAGTAATESQPAKPAKKSDNGKSSSSRGGMNIGSVLLLSYASAVTLILIMMLMRGTSAKPHHLESLPDVAPEPENKLSYVPINATLAPGHTLKLGEKRRFGNIEVEALRVTYEPLQFKHYSGNPGKKKPESAPVLKLWLRFTNVSADQTIAPLDRPLLLRWVARAGSTTEFSNQYLFPANKHNDPNAVVSTYRMPQTSDWDLVGQELDRELAPGESYETYIASTDDGTAEIKGPIVWRVQMRKGFSPQGHGVTTMIEVDFDRKEVQQG